MATTIGTEYDHIDITDGVGTIRHPLKDSTTRELAQNLIKVQDTQPESDDNVLWVKETPDNEVEVPTYDEFNELKSAFDNITGRGKNLLPVATIQKDLKGLNVTYSNGVLTRNGAASENINFRQYPFSYMKLPADTYTFWAENTALNTVYIVDATTNTIISVINSQSTGTFTLDTATYIYISVGATGGASYTDNITRLQLERAASKSEWEEPFTTAIDKIARANVEEYGDAISTNAQNIAKNTTDISDIQGGLIPLNAERTSQMYNSQSVLQTETDTHKFYKITLEYDAFELILTQESPKAFTNHWYNEYDANDNLLNTRTLSISVSPYTIIVNPDTAYIKLSMWNVNGAFSIATNIYGLIDRKIDIRDGGKKYTYISALGDSITYGIYYDNGVQKVVADTYQRLLAKCYGATFQNLGISSTPISSTSNYTGSENNNAFCRRYTSINANSDYIIVAGGTNDWGHDVPMGEPTDTTDVGFYGALDVLINGLLNNYPNARIVFITPFHRNYVNGAYDPDTNVNGQGKTLKDYCDAEKLKCAQYGIQCIDGNAESGINITNVFKSNFMPDGLHPNPAGHKKIFVNLFHALV